jgi:hypothetical protein
VQGPVDSWWTETQLEAAEAHAYQEVLKPQIDQLARSARSSAGGLLSIDVEVSEPDLPPPLIEPDDMRRVDFSCHPEEPTKVLDDWAGTVHCPICGTASSASRT